MIVRDRKYVEMNSKMCDFALTAQHSDTKAIQEMNRLGKCVAHCCQRLLAPQGYKENDAVTLERVIGSTNVCAM